MKVAAGVLMLCRCFCRGLLRHWSAWFVFVLSAAGASNAFAQATQLSAAGITACAARGSVTITVAGLSTTTPIACVNQAQQTSPGTSDKTEANASISILGLVSVADVSAAESIAQFALAPHSTILTGSAQASSASFAQGLIATDGVKGQVTCTANTGDRTLHCQASSTIAHITVAGQTATLPTPIPRNYSLPVQGNLSVTVLGLLVTVGVTGAAVLNEVSVDGVNTPTVTVKQHTVHLTLGGGATLSGGQVLNVQLDLIDDATAYVVVPNQGNWFTAVQVQ